ncbi:MAG: tryptophan synthase subunit alpha [Candidatus Brocadiia bacterium]
MNRIDARFARLAEAGQAAFIPFFTAGDPRVDATVRLLRQAEEAGADLIELGFPYSDPIADGPTIQQSYHRVLEGGLGLEEVFGLVREARQGCDLPIVAMISYSLVFHMGMERFIERALEAGIDGATVPDLPIEEAVSLLPAARERGFRLICFATPATTAERRALVAQNAAGFIYYISVRGITGERAELPPDLVQNIREMRAMTDVPIAVGFGISDPEQARAVARCADGVIVGSAIVKRMNAADQQGQDPVEAAAEFISAMARATHGTD